MKHTLLTQRRDMLLELDAIPRLHNILASFFTWILLAGYLVFPATFNSLQKDHGLGQEFNSGLKGEILSRVRSVQTIHGLETYN